MTSSPTKDEQCLFCSKSELISEDVNWIQCGRCKHWAHLSCAGVGQGDINSVWLCPQCFSSSGQQLKVPDATGKKRSKKSGQKSDGGSDQGAGSDVDPIEKQLEEEQLAKEKAFAKQIAVRKKLLTRQKAWKEEQLKQEREMRELELQVQREIEEQQLQQEQEMLDAQLAAEKIFLEKRVAIRKKYDSSVKRVNACRNEDGAVGEKSKSKPGRKMEEWLQQSTKAGKQTSAMDFRGAFSKEVDPLGAGSGNRLEQTVVRITREQLAARKAVSQHLPTFCGEPEVWPLFISSFEHTTAACGFSNLENLKRLQDCLQGDALEAVRSRLILPVSVPDVINDLRNLFGRPEKLLKTLITKVRNAPVPSADRLETFIHFGITVKQLCDHLDAAGLNDHLNNPMLVQELVDKLPPSYKLDWVRFKRGKVDSPLRLFTSFMTEIVSDVSEVTEFSTLSMNERRCGRNTVRKEFVHAREQAHNFGQRWCFICGEADHFVRNCEEFRRMNIEERLLEVELLGLCEVCLNRHRKGHCLSQTQCTERDCRGKHHFLLHRVEESVQLQKVKSDCNVIFRMMPVTLHVGERHYDTVAFLDEGSSATLVDDVVAKRLKAEGITEPLIVTWTGNINRFENESRNVDIMMSAKGSEEKFPLFNARTVSELQLPKQNVQYAELVKRYNHLAGVPRRDFPSGVPTILVGLDNLHLFAPLESRVGKPNEPIAVRSKMGWTIYGSEKQKASLRTYLNGHSAQPIRNQHLVDWRQQNVLDELACAVQKPTEDKRTRKKLEKTTKRAGKCSGKGVTWCQDGKGVEQILYESKKERSKQSLSPVNTTEVLQTQSQLHDVKVPAKMVDTNRLSKWMNLLLMIMCVVRFVSNCRRKSRKLPIETLLASNVVEAALGIRDDCVDQWTNARMEWKFNPPTALHLGGVGAWLVWTLKKALNDGSRLTKEISQTAIVEVKKFTNVFRERRIKAFFNRRAKWFGEARPLVAGDLLYVVERINRKCKDRRVEEEALDPATQGSAKRSYVPAPEGTSEQQ